MDILIDKIDKMDKMDKIDIYIGKMDRDRYLYKYIYLHKTKHHAELGQYSKVSCSYTPLLLHHCFPGFLCN